jgi:hypothetical protein
MIHKFNITENIFHQLKEDVRKKEKEYNSNLVGNIREEYALKDDIEKYEKFIIDKISENNFLLEHFKNIEILKEPQKLVLGNLWVNFQKKNEFNPVHYHSGVFSFILFIQIPFLMSDELKKSPGINSKKNLAGHLQFLQIDPYKTNNILIEDIPVDKTWEGTGLIFRSQLSHCVYPFFSSEDYRITVSGNIFFGN